MAFSANDYLMHHGILGMKWGKKNGPPYPLDPQDHSASEKKAGWRKSLGKSSSDKSSDSKKRGLSDKQKNALKIGVGLAVAGLAVYGGYKLSQLGLLDKSVDLGKNSVESIDLKGGFSASQLPVSIDTANDNNISNKESKIFNSEKAKHIADIIGAESKATPDTLEENVRLSNLDRDAGKPGMVYNCSHSAISWVMNEIGVKCKALPMYDEFEDSGMTPTEIKRYFKGLDWGITSAGGNTMTVNRSNSAEDCKKQIADKILEISNGENSAGIWRARAGYGHYMGWKVENGKVMFVDPQPGLFNCNKWFKGLALNKVDAGIDIARLDNLEVNERFIKKAIGRV